MSDISSIAAFSSSMAQARVADAVGITMLKIANAQQQSAATLLESAVAAAEAIQTASCDSCGQHVDVTA